MTVLQSSVTGSAADEVAAYVKHAEEGEPLSSGCLAVGYHGRNSISKVVLVPGAFRPDGAPV